MTQSRDTRRSYLASISNPQKKDVSFAAETLFNAVIQRLATKSMAEAIWSARDRFGNVSRDELF